MLSCVAGLMPCQILQSLRVRCECTYRMHYILNFKVDFMTKMEIYAVGGLNRQRTPSVLNHCVLSISTGAMKYMENM